MERYSSIRCTSPFKSGCGLDTPLSRGVGDDVDFICWLHERMWPFESNMTEEDSYVSTLMTSLELIRSGVT